jgi:hypothetical protein
MKSADKNDNGTIEFNEFLDVMSEHLQETDLEQDLRMAFRLFDEVTILSIVFLYLKDLISLFLPCVPGIVAFINKDIELRIFYLLLLRLNHFCIVFTKNLRPKRMPACILTIDIYDSHTQADKIDRLLYNKNIISITIYYSLLLM